VMGWCRSGGTDLVVWLEVRGEVMGFRPKSQNCKEHYLNLAYSRARNRDVLGDPQ
jgi:hypothetical protein